jgi:hypothetical protein
VRPGPGAPPTELRRLVAKGRFAARCEDCAWSSTAKNAQAGAASHARTRRHRTIVRVERMTIFDGRGR